jgi:hypothetical protein
MIHKSKLYAKEQKEIIYNIIAILELDDKNSITLYELDNDKDKTQKIIDLIPSIRKYFTYNNIKAVYDPSKIRRPWLSIIKQLTKIKYDILIADYRIPKDSKKTIRTKRYYFNEK